jgi:hypothetical protein
MFQNFSGFSDIWMGGLRCWTVGRQGYKLVLTGHSLGGSIASLLTMLVRETGGGTYSTSLKIRPSKIFCWGYGSAPCVDRTLATSSNFICNVVLQVMFTFHELIGVCRVCLSAYYLGPGPVPHHGGEYFFFKTWKSENYTVYSTIKSTLTYIAVQWIVTIKSLAMNYNSSRRETLNPKYTG